MRNRFRHLSYAFGLGFMFALSGCAHRRPMDAIVTDVRGAPISGALVYVEAWKHPGAYDFCFGWTDATGRIPRTGKSSPELSWKWKARLAYIAFAPGKQPFAAISYTFESDPGNIHIQLQDSTAAVTGMNVLGFPFPDNAELAKRASLPEAAPVRSAFREYYRGIKARGGLHAEGRSKLEALGKIPDPESAN